MKEYKIKIRNIFIIFLTLILSPILFFLIKRKKKEKEKNLKILIIPQLTRIGDLVCSTPVFRAIKLSYPESYLSVLVSNKASGIIKNNTRIDEIIIYENYSFLGMINKIRKENFDWGFSLSATSLSTVVMFLSFIKNRAKIIRGNKPITEKLTDWLNDFKLLYKDHTYLPKYYLDLLKFIGIVKPEEKKEVFFSDEGDKKTEIFFIENSISKSDILIGISISAGNKIKEWGDKNFLELSKKITKKYSNTKIIFIGSQKDDFRIENILKSNKSNNFLKITSLSLDELPSIMKRLNLFVAVDTGLIYIAHAIGISLVDIVGPVDPSEQPPEDKKSSIVKPDRGIKPSSFVFKKRGDQKDIKKALESTSVEMVFEVVDKLLKI